MSTSVFNFNFVALLVSKIKRMFQNLMWWLLALSSTPYAETFTCPPSTWQDQTSCRISMHHAVMRICISHRLTIICAQKWDFGGFGGEDVRILSSDPQKALPCVNTRLMMYRVSKSVQRPEL